MPGNSNRPSTSDGRDRREALRILAGLAVVLVVVALGIFLVWPEVQIISAEHLEPGLGLKTAFLWGFGLAFAVFVAFAIVSGDGLVGELPVMLGTFLLFWVIFSLVVAWIF